MVVTIVAMHVDDFKEVEEEIFRSQLLLLLLHKTTLSHRSCKLEDFQCAIKTVDRLTNAYVLSFDILISTSLVNCHFPSQLFNSLLVEARHKDRALESSVRLHRLAWRQQGKETSISRMEQHPRRMSLIL